MRIPIQPKQDITGKVAVSFQCTGHVVISGVLATEKTPAVPGTIKSQLTFFSDDGREITSFWADLTPEQYVDWNNGVVDDDAYFTSCHVKNLGLTVA